MISKLKTAPATEPISLRQAKLNLRLAVTDADADAYDYEDDLISRLITAAREYVEHYTGKRLVSQVWELYLDSWPADGVITLPESGVLSVASMTYNGTAFTDYTADLVSETARLVLNSDSNWPTTTLNDVNPIKITYTVGYVTVPSAATTAMHLIIGSMYNNRESFITGSIATNLPLGVNAMLDTIRRYT